MIDMAGNYRPYMDDMTRTFAIGKVPEIAYHAHQVSIDIHNEIWETAKPGTLCSDLYLLAEKRRKKINSNLTSWEPFNRQNSSGTASGWK